MKLHRTMLHDVPKVSCGPAVCWKHMKRTELYSAKPGKCSRDQVSLQMKLAFREMKTG